MAQVKVGGPAAGLAEAVGSSAETAAALSVAEAAAADGTTLSGTIAQRLRDEILSGGRAPGARLRLEDLRSRFGVSWSPLREAVSRLVAEGLIVADGARSYQVAPATRRELAETLRLRILLETTALRLAIQRGDDAWEAQILSAQHRLGKLEAQRIVAAQALEWERWHRAYHDALTAACDSPILLQFCQTLHDRHDRYRRLYLSAREVDRDVASEHREITDATLAREEDRACALLSAHIERTGRNILQTMPD